MTILSQLHLWIHLIHEMDPTYGGSKNRFETYVKAKDLDLRHIILNGDFPPVSKNEVTQILEVVPFEEKSDDLKKKLAKNNEAKMVLYNALPTKEYERIFMYKMAKDIWQSLLITHLGNNHVKENKIDLLVKKYKQFTILEEESTDSGFARFNTIITSFKALDEESKDLSSLALDNLIGNLKVHDVVMEKDSEIYKGKKERIKSIALKAKKESSNDENSTFESNQEKKRSHSDKGMRRKGRVAKNDLDAVIQIISLAIVQNHLATKIKMPSLEVLGAIAKMTSKTKLMIKLVSLLNRQMRYTWTRFLKTKTEAFEKFEILSRKIQNQLGSSIIAIRMDHGQEFDNEVQFGAYCDAQGITHNFLAPRKPPYEIFRGREPSLEYFKVFGSKCFILNTKDYLTKFDPKSYEGVFLGYSRNSKAYIVLNKYTMKVEELLNVTFDESPPLTKLSPLVDDDVGEEEATIKNTKVVNNNNEEDESIEVDEIVTIKESKNHPLD
ncbi:DUF4219 domain-containing protein [Tanacetum coccineum]